MDEMRNKGDVGENWLVPVIQARYPEAYQKPFKEGVFLKGDIIIPEIDEMIEVKMDYKQLNYNNIAIEDKCMGHPSGIATTESKWWVILNPNKKFWLIYPEEIKLMIKRNEMCEYNKWDRGQHYTLTRGIQHNPNFFNEYSKQNLSLYFIPAPMFEKHCIASGTLEDFPLNLIK